MMYDAAMLEMCSPHDRIAIRDVFDDVGSKYVPPHVNISIGFGTLPRRHACGLPWLVYRSVSRSLSCLTG